MDRQTHSHDPERSRRLLQMIRDLEVEALLEEVSLPDSAEAWNCYELRHAHDNGGPDTSDPDWWAALVWTGDIPEHLMRDGLLSLVDTVDESLLGLIGAGPLEDFISDNEDDLRWIELNAANNRRFRIALQGVWPGGRASEATVQRLDAAAGQPLHRSGSPTDDGPAGSDTP